MALAKKGTRLIRVDGRTYRWAVSRASGHVTLVVEVSTKPGQRLVVSIPYDPGKVTPVAGTEVLDEKNIAPPALVRRAIAAGLSRGWRPPDNLPPLRIEVHGKDLMLTGSYWL